MGAEGDTRQWRGVQCSGGQHRVGQFTMEWRVVSGIAFCVDNDIRCRQWLYLSTMAFVVEKYCHCGQYQHADSMRGQKQRACCRQW